MQILLQPSDYRFLNAGDGAMMEVAMGRLLQLWPGASVYVLTDHPELLPTYSPQVFAVSNEGRSQWSLGGSNGGSQHPEYRPAIDSFLKLVQTSDLFVVTGMGGITSAFTEYSDILLNTIELAQAWNIPTILLGQGLGPFDGDLLPRARSVLRSATHFALREGFHGPRLLREWGVDPARWAVTGDDALELAVRYRTEETGKAIGFNIRTADYSGVALDQVQSLRDPICRFSQECGAPVRIIPISRLPEEDDGKAARRLLGPLCRIEEASDLLDSPARVIEHIRGCRVVVTGSYHAAVFALGQGIPAIGLAKSEYYRWKFEGLAHQFPGGCATILLGTAGSNTQLWAELERLWQAGPGLRDSLRAAAERQVAAGRSIYRNLPELAGIRRKAAA